MAVKIGTPKNSVKLTRPLLRQPWTGITFKNDHF